MAGNVVSAASGGRHRRRRRAVMSEINVTPFVDVMLVLLIVFMVSAPLLTVGVPVNLPKSQATTPSQTPNLLTISVDEQGRIYLQDSQVPADQLMDKLKAIADTRGGANAPIYFRGDLNLLYSKGVRYKTVMSVLGLLNSAGYDNVMLVTEFDSTPLDQNGR